MKFRSKLCTGLGAALLASTALPTLVEASTWQIEIAATQTAQPDAVQLASENGESGEAGESGDSSALIDDAAYLTELGLMRGHLYVGLELYRAGQSAAAKTHMKHPESELYAAVEPALEARGAPGFTEELERLASAVEMDAPLAEVEQAYANVEASIAAAEAAAGEGDAGRQARVILGLVRTAAEEFDVAVEDGKLVNAHEYQDALGFTHIAGGLAAGLKARFPGNSRVADILARIEEIKPSWPSLVPPKEIATNPSLLYGAAARIEIAAQNLD